MDFEVIRGGLLDIKFVIRSPAGTIFEKVVFFNRDDEANEKNGHISQPVTMSGVHSVCFDNSMSRWTAKVVSFALKSQATTKDTLENAKLEHLGPVVDSVIKISDELDQIERLQHHLRIREQVHRDTQESTNSRVQWFALVEACVLVGLSVLQLYYIHTWFADTSQRRRV